MKRFTPMLGDDDTPRPELFVADGLHLTPQGYALRTLALAPLLSSAPRQ